MVHDHSCMCYHMPWDVGLVGGGGGTVWDYILSRPQKWPGNWVKTPHWSPVPAEKRLQVDGYPPMAQFG